MTVEFEAPTNTFNMNNQTEAQLDYYVENKENIKVTKNGILVSPLEYTVTSLKSYLGGRVIFNTPITGSLVVKRYTSVDRSFNYNNTQNNIKPESLNNDFDRIWRSQQEQDVALDDEALIRATKDLDLQAQIDQEEAARIASDAWVKAYAESLAYVSGVTDDANVKVLQPFAGAITRTQHDKNLEFISVKDFGAVGDGVTDDTLAIQRAIDSLPLNTANTGIMTPNGFANGGEIFIPRGRYKITSTLTLLRGIKLRGESRESSQIISFVAGSVLQYQDAGRAIPDEIVISSLSIWQHSSVTATSGAAIDVTDGVATVQAVFLRIDDVLVKGTYHGIRLSAAIGCGVRDSMITNTVSHGIAIPAGIGFTQSTSTVFENVYSQLSVTGSGFFTQGTGYCAFLGCASDSNAQYGYAMDGTGGGLSIVSCGAERNLLAGGLLRNTNSATVQLRVVSGANGSHGIVLDNASGITLVSPALSADVGNTGFGVLRITARELTVLNPYFDGPYSTNKYSSTDRLFQSGFGFAGGSKLNYAFGGAQSVATTALVTYTGLLEPESNHTINLNATHTDAGVSYNAAVNASVHTANTAVTYPLVVALRVPNASKGAASTITRSAGQYIMEQTQGTNANANIMIDAGEGTVPVGDWSIYSGSTRTSRFKGALSLGATGTTLYSGTGSPEGVLSAIVGSLYTRTDGGAGSTLYIKESGAGATGWVAK